MLTGEDKKYYKLTEKFNYVNTLWVSVKGFEQKDLKKLDQLKQELDSNPKIKKYDQINNKQYQEFKSTYKFYLNDFNYKEHSDINIKDNLTSLYNEMISSMFYVNIDKSDPFKIIKSPKEQNKLQIKNGNLILKDHGYLSVFLLQSKSDEVSRIKIYNEIQDILSKYDDVISFSPVFYYVENSQKIQGDVRIIIFTSMLILSMLYILILKNLYLFINIAATLITSIILGQIVTTYIFPNTSIIALVFSTAITSVSIDYMFHHYLHRYYDYDKKQGFNKPVFYGFLTTLCAFILISMINFPLIQQISIFAVTSLSVSYIHFAFIYPHIGIKYKEPYKFKKSSFKRSFSFKGYKIISLSIVIFLGSVFFSKFDFNIKNLDYQNQKLIKNESFFKSKIDQKDKAAVLITGNTINEVIANSKFIKQLDTKAITPLSSLLSQKEYIEKSKTIKQFNFEKLKKDIDSTSQELGLFKKDYFKSSYSNEHTSLEYPNYTLQMINQFGFNLVYDQSRYITYAMVSLEHLDEILKLDFIKSAQSKVLFENSLKKTYDELLLFGTITIVIIITIIGITARKRFMEALSYIIFPSSLIIIYSWFIPLNIMHIFMGFVILAIGIDYGIYMSEKELPANTSKAIIFSLISTFAGFGILIISDINSLFSIGTTAVIGITAILFLLLFQKRSNSIS